MYKKQLETKKCICEHHQHPNEFIAGLFKAHLILAPACSLPFNLQMTVSPNTVLPSIKLGHEYTKGSREAGYLLQFSLKGIHPVSCWAAGGLIKRGYAYWPLYGHPMQVKCEHQMSSFLFIIMKFPSPFEIPICCHFQALLLPPSKLSFHCACCQLSELAF